MTDPIDSFKNSLRELREVSSSSDTAKNATNLKPLSGSQIKDLAKLATSDLNKNYKLVVHYMDEFMYFPSVTIFSLYRSKCTPNYLLSSLYLIDAIIKYALRHKTNKIVARFASVMPKLLTTAFDNSILHDQVQILELLNIWKGKDMFRYVLDPIISKYTPIVEEIKRKKEEKKRKKEEEKQRKIKEIQAKEAQKRAVVMPKRAIITKKTVLASQYRSERLQSELEDLFSPKPVSEEEEGGVEVVAKRGKTGIKTPNVPPNCILYLPDEVLVYMLQFVPTFPDRSRVSGTCKRLNILCMDSYLYKSVNFEVFSFAPAATISKHLSHAYKALTDVDLSWCRNVNNEMVFTLMEHTAEQLVSLNIEGCNISNGAFIHEFATVESTTQLFTNLEYLNLGYCKNLNSIVIVMLVESNPKLSFLSVNECPIESVQFPRIIEYGKNLSTLHIQCCHDILSRMETVVKNLKLDYFNVSCYCNFFQNTASYWNLGFWKLVQNKSYDVATIKCAGYGPPAIELDTVLETEDVWYSVTYRGTPDYIEQLLIQGRNPNARGLHGCTALCKAVELKQQKIVSILLEYGADPNRIANVQSPLSLSTSFEMVNLLLSKGAIARAESERAIVSITKICTMYRRFKAVAKDLEAILTWLKSYIEAVPKLFIAEVFHYFALYMEDRQFFKAFIAQAPFERRQLINATLNRDQFFNIAMKYLSRDQHTQILLAIGEGGYAQVKDTGPSVAFGADDD